MNDERIEPEMAVRPTIWEAFGLDLIGLHYTSDLARRVAQRALADAQRVKERT